jgi:hypothetical protein
MDMSKILELKERYPGDADQLDSLYQEYQKAFIISDLKDHGGVRELLALLDVIVNSINGTLLSNEKMTEHERDLYLAERKCYSWLQTTLASFQNTVDGMDNFLEDKSV